LLRWDAIFQHHYFRFHSRFVKDSLRVNEILPDIRSNDPCHPSYRCVVAVFRYILEDMQQCHFCLEDLCQLSCDTDG
jgi:hypothetical protein